ncbi:MAG: DUF4231 domain-containing protein [Hyphomicrobium sp.]
MCIWRTDKTVTPDTFSSATEYYSSVRQGLREKADHNKLESQAAFYAVICFTLASPLFVTLGSGLVFGKVVPAVLSVLAAAATAWLQLRKPQRLWAIYRRAQRELEREKVAHDFLLGEYESAPDRDKLLAERISAIAFDVHERWEGLVPEPEAIISTTPALSPRGEGNVNGE